MIYPRLFALAFAGLVGLLSLCSYNTASPHEVPDEIEIAVNDMMAAPIGDATQQLAANHLMKLVRDRGTRAISDRDVSILITLVDMDNEMIRSSAIYCLGYGGKKARSAIPKLENLLHQVACDPRNRLSDGALRLTLARMGINVAPCPQFPGCSPDSDPNCPSDAAGPNPPLH